MNEWLSLVKSVETAVWGVPLLTLLVGVGLYLTIVLRGVQFRYLGRAFGLMRVQEDKKSSGDISPFQSLMTSMASAVGTGSIVGVATAISAGGLGSIFWLWITVILSMAIKYAEAILAVKYRVVDGRGEMAGGPMYYIERGLHWKPLAIFFAVAASIAAIGTGNLVQINSIAEAVHSVFSVDPLMTGVILAVITGVVLLGGIKTIGKLSAWLVPIMALFYISSGLIVLFVFYDRVPDAVRLIISSAFTGQAAFGGFLGSTVMMAVQMGVARSIFCSEAGMGISSIAAAAARTPSSGHQAMLSMVGTLVSTAIICSITTLVIAVSGTMGSVNADGSLVNGASLAIAAFRQGIPGGEYIVMVGLILFAYSTVIAWAYYGEKCFEYLFGVRSVLVYRILYTVLVIPGAIFTLQMVWSLANIMNAFMVIPNMLALFGLSGVVQKETEAFLAHDGKGAAHEGEEHAIETIVAAQS